MRVLLFGASGMVGQGVLRECLLANDVEHVAAVVRRPLGTRHPKLEEIVVSDPGDLGPVADRLGGFDACFFPLGTTSVGKSEVEYSRITFDLTLAAATTVARLNPGRLTFVYVSGAGTDSTERGATMWARVKGRTENALLRLPFKRAYMLRPGVIQPRHGIRSKTALYRAVYVVLWPVAALLVVLGAATTTDRVGRAMLHLAREGYPDPILGNREINAIGR
ncbi:MAG TPA: epimerase [Thermoplasmata archaeon]|nr:epimerase [Thermoplasmata archaeon]